MKINIKYMISFIILLLVEVFIGAFINDKIIRPYVGDILVVVVIYTFIKIFIKKEVKMLPVYIFIFAVMVEVMQYYNIVELLNLQHNKLMSIIIGSTFDMKDIFCYFIGAILLIIWESINRKYELI